MKTKHPRICFVGNMLGKKQGFIPTQGQIIADLFEEEGYEIISVSSKINKVLRLADIIWTIIRKRKQIDLVVLEVYSGLSMVMANVTSSLCKLLKLPLISVLHGGNLPNFANKYPRWVKRVLGLSNILIAPSSFLAEKLRFFGLEIKIIPNVLRIDEYPFRIRRNISPKFIWMRSFHSLYNPQMAVRAFSKIQQTYSQATLVMAGRDKGIESEVKQLVKDLDLEKSVRFVGFLDSKAKLKEFSEADIYLNTNKIDNMPVSVVEACAMGLPVVATEVGGLSHLITNGLDGVLVSDDNAEEMADAIKKILDDSELTEIISRNGRLLAEKSSWESVRKLWESLFVEVLEERKTSGKVFIEKNKFVV